MKCKKYILPLLVIILSNISLFGYNFRFTNTTERFLVLCYKLEGLSQEYFQIIPPDQSVSHHFKNLHCLGQSILWAEVKTHDIFGRELPFGGGIDLIDPETDMIPLGNMQQLFKDYLANKYAFIPMQIKVVSNETFQLTADAAAKLARGIDTFACQTIKTVAQFMSATPNTPNSPNSPDNQNSPNENNVLPALPALPNEILPTHMDITNINQTDPSAARKAIKDCRFGLGKIAAAGADLAGVSLCRDLWLIVTDTGEVGSPAPTKPGTVVSRVKKPILIAEINQGG